MVWEKTSKACLSWFIFELGSTYAPFVGGCSGGWLENEILHKPRSSKNLGSITRDQLDERLCNTRWWVEFSCEASLTHTWY